MFNTFTYVNLIQTSNGCEVDISTKQSPAMMFDQRDQYIDSYVFNGEPNDVRAKYLQPLLLEAALSDMSPRKAARRIARELRDFRIFNPIARDFVNKRDANLTA